MLVPDTATDGANDWLVGFSWEARMDTSTTTEQVSGVLMADQYGNNGRFLDLGHLWRGWAIAPRWDSQHSRVYFATEDATPGLFRYDLASDETDRVRCSGMRDDVDVDMLCLSPDGNSIVLGAGDTRWMLTGLTAECVARRVAGLRDRRPHVEVGVRP